MPQDPEQLKQAFMRLLRTKRNEAGYFRARARMSWEKLFGKYVAENTRDMRVRSGRLYVYVTNAPLRTQLTTVREQIRDRLNEEFGEDYLTEVVIK